MHMMWSSALLTFLFLICALLEKSSGTMNCFVSRPGYGLVSEECPANTVACRIRIDHNAVEFYQYSPLYDRNQFVCVLKNEYGSEQRSGCLQKRSGRIRCWCFGHSNCNTPETSKLLYTAFVSGDEQHFQEVVEKIDFSDISLVGEEDLTSTVVTTPSPTRSPARIEVTKGVRALSEEKHRQGQRMVSTLFSTSNAQNNKEEVEGTNTAGARLKFMRYSGVSRDAGDSRKVGTGRVDQNNPSLTAAFSKSSSKNNSSLSAAKSSSGAMLMKENSQEIQGHLHRMHVHKASQLTTSNISPTTTTMSTKVVEPLKTTTKLIKSEFDTKNQVHIIHVNAKDEYEHVIGSQQFADILDAQKAVLNAQNLSSTFSSILREEMELDGKDLEEDQMDEAEDSLASLDMIDANPSSQQADLRRRQRNGFDSTTSARTKASELEEDSLEEYFDSAFYTSLAAKNSFRSLAILAAAFAFFYISLIFV